MLRGDRTQSLFASVGTSSTQDGTTASEVGGEVLLLLEAGCPAVSNRTVEVASNHAAASKAVGFDRVLQRLESKQHPDALGLAATQAGSSPCCHDSSRTRARGTFAARKATPTIYGRGKLQYFIKGFL